MQKGKPGKGYKFPKGHILSQGSNNGMSGKSHSAETKKSMSALAIARGSHHLKNIPKTDLYKENMRKSKQIKKYKLISPDGIEYMFDRAQDASKFSGVSVAVIVKLAGNRYGFSHCRNWQCISIPV
jgi:hypothetical protein